MRTIKYATARQGVYKQTHTWLNLHVALDATVTAPQWRRVKADKMRVYKQEQVEEGVNPKP